VINGLTRPWSLEEFLHLGENIHLIICSRRLGRHVTFFDDSHTHCELIMQHIICTTLHGEQRSVLFLPVTLPMLTCVQNCFTCRLSCKSVIKWSSSILSHCTLGRLVKYRCSKIAVLILSWVNRRARLSRSKQLHGPLTKRYSHSLWSVTMIHHAQNDRLQVYMQQSRRVFTARAMLALQALY